jgi:hypothetical protein
VDLQLKPWLPRANKATTSNRVENLLYMTFSFHGRFVTSHAMTKACRACAGGLPRMSGS